MEEQNKIKLELTLQSVDLILKALSELPYKHVAFLMQEISVETQKQVSERKNDKTENIKNA